PEGRVGPPRRGPGVAVTMWVVGCGLLRSTARNLRYNPPVAPHSTGGLDMSRPVALVIAFALLVPTFLRADPPPASQPVYSTCKPSQDGIGKVYMGREIAFVMGHQGIHWLERPTRELEEQPRKAIEMMELKPTDVIADIGAGSGYFSFRMASKVPQGKVL